MKPGLVFDMQNQRVSVQVRQGFFTITNIMPYPPFLRVTNLSQDHVITKKLEAITMPYVSPIEGGKALAKSSYYSWYVERVFNLSPLRDFNPPDEFTGPYTVACVVHDTLRSAFQPKLKGLGRLVVTGTSKLIGQYGSPSGETFFLNACDWLAQDELLIAIRSKVIIDRPIKQLTPVVRNIIKYLNMLLPIVGLIGFGLLRLKLRRKKIKERIGEVK